MGKTLTFTLVFKFTLLLYSLVITQSLHLVIYCQLYLSSFAFGFSFT